MPGNFKESENKAMLQLPAQLRETFFCTATLQDKFYCPVKFQDTFFLSSQILGHVFLSSQIPGHLLLSSRIRGHHFKSRQFFSYQNLSRIVFSCPITVEGGLFYNSRSRLGHIDLTSNMAQSPALGLVKFVFFFENI